MDYVNCGLQRIMICQGRVMDCNKCTTVVQDINSWENSACVGSGSKWKLYFLLNFAVNLNVLKNKFH